MKRLAAYFPYIALAALGIALGAVMGTAGPAGAAEPAARVRVFDSPESVEGPSRTGFIPTPGDFSHLRAATARTLTTLPERFDWRTQGVVTEVGDQGTCGCCYAFAAVSNFESAILIDGGPLWDFSVNNVKECDWWALNTGLASCSGGNASMVANFLSQKGIALETCDPFDPRDRICKDDCPFYFTLTGWLQISGDEVAPTSAIKDYVYNRGPMFVAMVAANGVGWPSELSAYDGSYTLYYDGPGSLDHAVMIVGWDDTLSHVGGQGAWIVLNSWGEDWGDDGFFYIAYGSAQIGAYASTIYDWQPYDTDGLVFYHDDAGFMGTALGYENTTGWAMAKYVPDEDVRLERVEFWTTDAASDVDVYVYDGFNGTALLGELAREENVTIEAYGYHSIELSTPVDVSATNDVYVVVKITNDSYSFPIALDNYGPASPGYCYVSPTGASWTDLTEVSGCTVCSYSDVCVRLRGTRISTSGVIHVPGDYPTLALAITAVEPGDTVLVGPGTYQEGGLEIDEDIVLMSEAGPESTIISAVDALAAPGAQASVLSLTGVTNACQVKGLTVKGAVSGDMGGGIVLTNADASIVDCIVTLNSATTGAGIVVQNSTPFIVNCTVAENTGFAGIYFDSGSGGWVNKCIVSGTAGGPGIYCISTSPVIECCDIYGNAGTIVNGTDNGGNFFEDPLYCGRVDGDYGLQEGSPCIAGYGCGRIGALGQGCESQVPGMLASFVATPGDLYNRLTWTLPEEPVEGAYIIYKTTGYPTSWTDGTAVENGMYGYFDGTAGASDTFDHTGLTNGVTYYYAAYAYNLDYRSNSPLLDSAMPADQGPPAGVSDFSVQSGDGTLHLSWTYPPDPDLVGVMLRYSTTDYPGLPTDGTPLENGSGGVFLGEPGNDTSFTHTGLDNDTTYFYSAFSYDAAENYSDAVIAAGTPGFDGIPPGEVRSFVAVASDSTVTLSWLNPTDDDFVQTVLRYSTTAYPGTPQEGTPVENGSGGIFPAAPASADTFIHMGLDNGTTYYYTAFTADTMPNYSSGASVFATPVDMTDPELAISVFRNPYITNYLDIYLMASEELLLDSLYVTVDGDEVDMEIADSDDFVYRGDYDLYATGAITIKARARDLALNRGTEERQFSSSLILASVGGTAVSADGVFGLTIPPGAAAGDTYILVWERTPERDEGIKTYEASPVALDVADYMRIEFAYDESADDPRHLAIIRGSGAHSVNLNSYVDTASRNIVAYTRELGVFSLIRDGGSVTPPLEEAGVSILYNSPNPFEHATEIVYQVPKRSRVSIEIVGIDGRYIRTLYSGSVAAGRHSIGWDGRDSGGRGVASGIYFIRIVSPSGVAGRKIAVLR